MFFAFNLVICHLRMFFALNLVICHLRMFFALNLVICHFLKVTITLFLNIDQWRSRHSKTLDSSAEIYIQSCKDQHFTLLRLFRHVEASTPIWSSNLRPVLVELLMTNLLLTKYYFRPSTLDQEYLYFIRKMVDKSVDNTFQYIFSISHLFHAQMIKSLKTSFGRVTNDQVTYD